MVPSGVFKVDEHSMGADGGFAASDRTLKLSEADEKMVLLRTIHELARSNHELERFAARIAHDLRTPLVSIRWCATSLAENASADLAPGDRQMIDFIMESAHQLSRLVENLLNYACIGRGQLHRVSCNLTTVLNRVLSNLQSAIETSGALIQAKRLPDVWADDTLIGELFQNLIENALKYRGDDPPVIQISAREEMDRWVFAVQDNGIGIPIEHQTRIFEAFERLHPTERDYPGQGIGLATCKLIVEKHGGQIWVESTPGLGSVFYFSLPKSVNDL